MRTSKALAKWRAGVPVLGVTLHFNDPSVYELTSLLGFDLIWMDLEHHAHSLETAGNLMRAARVGTSDILARPAKGEFTRTARLLEAGAQGILYPRCTSADEAAELVRHAKFAPLGQRGLDGAGPDMPYGLLNLKEYLAAANRETYLIVQIEDAEGLANAEAIARVEGVDMLFFGPGDYSVEMGFPGQFDDPRYQEALDEVARAARAAGKWWGTPCFSTAHAQQLLDQGAMLITRSSDITLVRLAFQQIQKDFTALGLGFGA
ncbi:2-keto-3-deoxy-L-rhamnonate aldolase [Rhabdobacter roseus]|uniref:4-hydroxy-2-oxoheptanedioate aldolase n=1 Tax=Rhabdobacter roseus TaxID=1655419 RepID=A0A840TP73_9BACT|nr:aldolase/citrate lyase family protein [Rhabdobacter roseus]MBB5283023.1 4-hydroxy-2-oxoheptanedioate aldolase [Rhabdobacter roseus]